MHRNHPQVATSTLDDVAVKDSSWKYCVFRTQHDPSRMATSPDRLRDPMTDPSDKIVHRASEPSPPDRWGATLSHLNVSIQTERTAIPGQTSRPNSGTFTNPLVRRPQIDADHTRPETHQNLIHISKEQHDQTQQGDRTNGMTTRPGTLCPGT
jgi:hypothetical protein